MQEKLLTNNNNQTSKINFWSLLNLLFNYLKRNKSILITLVTLPFWLTTFMFLTIERTMSSNLFLITLLIFQTSTVSSQVFLTIIYEFKQSVIYRRIGLTRIKISQFFVVTALFNVLINVILDVIAFLCFIFLNYVFTKNFHFDLLNIYFFLNILIVLTATLMFSVINLFFTIVFNTRTILNFVSLVINLFLSGFVLLLSIIVAKTIDNSLVKNFSEAGKIFIIIAIFAFLIGTCGFFHCLNKKLFYWSQ